jgi:ABC-type multidrug transport system ATPase subunit
MSPQTMLRPMMFARSASVELRDGTRLLDAASVEVRGGEHVVLVGPSGAGTTTLLETLAGIRQATTGTVEVHAQAVHLGYVPQDDIVHRELTVWSTVHYAARLRLPTGTSAEDTERAVERTLTVLGLSEQRGLRVGALSGGQRKRVSIATELVVQPRICLLDEPTAGLDPAAAASLMAVLRKLADAGTAIVMTTHNLADLRVATRVVVMADGGRIVFDGPPSAAGDHLPFEPGQSRTDERSVTTTPPTAWDDDDPPPAGTVDASFAQRRSFLQQCMVLAKRNFELMRRNRMNLAIMAGSPVLIVGMFVTLFPSNTFDVASVDRSVAIGIVYWLAFAGFFFGLTFGLLQICTEMPIVRRERLVSIDLGPYLLAKAALLVPVLGVTNLIMILTLSAFDRLPALGAADMAGVWLVLGVDALAGLAIGLLASASVTSAAQAALALPMLCFPAVLFSGAVLPVTSMAAIGRSIAAFTSDRWAFEALARTLDVGAVPAGTPARRAVELHGDALTGSIGFHVLVMFGLAALFTAGARVVLARRCR